MKIALEVLLVAVVVVIALAPVIRAAARRRRAPVRPGARALPRDAELFRRALPRLPRRFAEAFTEEQLFGELWRFAEEAELRFVEVRDTRDGGDRRLLGWPHAGDGAAREPGGVTASYPLGRERRAVLRFGWRCELGDVPPEAEILLQIVADLLAGHLARLQSALAPAVDPAQEQETEAPDVLDLPARPSHV